MATTAAIMNIQGVWEAFGALLAVGVCAVLILVCNAATVRVSSWIKETIISVFTGESYNFSAEDSLKHKRVQEIVQHLRDSFDADRVALFQYHNGDVYLLGSHTWKSTCTYEVAKAGSTYVSDQNSALLASRIVDMVEPMLSGDSLGARGVKRVQTCPVPRACLVPVNSHWIIHHEVANMSMCMFRFLCEQQGVDNVYSVNLVHGDKKSGIGYISLQFGKLNDAEKLIIESKLCLMCTAAEQAQFLLQDNSGNIKLPGKGTVKV